VGVGDALPPHWSGHACDNVSEGDVAAGVESCSHGQTLPNVASQPCITTREEHMLCARAASLHHAGIEMVGAATVGAAEVGCAQQSVAESLPAALVMPAGHSVADDAPCEHQLPAGHAAHADAPPDAWYSPALQDSQPVIPLYIW